MIVGGRVLISAGSARERVLAPGLGRLARDAMARDARVSVATCSAISSASALSSCQSNRRSSSASSVQSKKKKKKRAKLKKSAAPSKKDLIRQPSRMAEEESALSSAVKNLDAKSLQANLQEARDSFRDYARSLFSSNHERARRTKLNMDFHWWKWNLLVMVSPSVLLVLYCHHVRPQAEAFHREQRRLERRRIMGDEWTEEVDREIQEMERLQTLQLQQPFFQKILSSIADLTGFSDTFNSPEERPEPRTSHTSQTGAQTNSALAQPQKTPSTNDQNQPLNQPQSQPQNHEYQNIISSLLKRIEILEARLDVPRTSHTNQQIDQKLDLSKTDQHHRQKYLTGRTQQSPIQNRAEDRQIDQWKKEREDRLALLNKLKQHHKQQDQITHTQQQHQKQYYPTDTADSITPREDETMFDVLLRGIQQYSKHRVDETIQSAKNTLNEVKDQILGSHENDKNNIEEQEEEEEAANIEAKNDGDNTDAQTKEIVTSYAADQNSLHQSSPRSSTLAVADAAVEASTEALKAASEAAVAAEAASLSAKEAAAAASNISSNTDNNAHDISNTKETHDDSASGVKGSVVGWFGSWLSKLIRRRPQDGAKGGERNED